jgi:hypothetical protein
MVLNRAKRTVLSWAHKLGWLDATEGTPTKVYSSKPILPTEKGFRGASFFIGVLDLKPPQKMVQK